MPQFSQEMLEAAGKAAVKDIFRGESAEKTLARLRSMGLNDKAAAIVYSHARDQVKMVRRRIIALLMLLGAIFLLMGLMITTIQLWPDAEPGWRIPWAGLIVTVVGAALMGLSYWRWRRHIRT